MERILITIATYNERENLPELMRRIHAQVPAADILVIDDHSPDGTGPLADALAAADPRILVLHRPGKLGLGTAILAGMRFAIQGGYGLMVNMDADFSHDPRYLPALLAGMADRDVMIGSRYVPGGGVKNWPWKRHLISRLVSGLSEVLLGLPARDTSGGYRCYRVSLLRRIRLEDVRSRGYSFQEEMLYRCRRAGARIGETPIVFEERRAGSSKVDLGESVRSLAVLFWLALEAALGPERDRP